jgi:hypothetical protein
MTIRPCKHGNAHEVEATTFDDLGRGVRTFVKICPDCAWASDLYEKPRTEEKL